MQEFTYTGKAMGTDFSVAIVTEDERIALTLSEGVRNTIHSYEARFSRFLPESELSKLNRAGTAIVSPEFLEVLLEAERLFNLTHGVFNPLVQIGRLGYVTTFETIENTELVSSQDEPYDIDFSTTSIDPVVRSVVLNEGQKLDFGGFLKGFLAEKMAKELMASEDMVQGTIVNLGGDIHTRGLDAEGAPFLFSIYNPITQKDDFHLPLKDTSLATSGIYKRMWMHGDIPTHHILDPSGTHNPDSDIVSASVVHASGGMTEACAKVFLSLGIQKASQVLEGHGMRYVIITKNGTLLTDTI